MARTIGRILLTLAILAITGFVLLVLIGLWDRHEQAITAGLRETLNTRRGGGFDSQSLARPSAPSHAAVSFEE